MVGSIMASSSSILTSPKQKNSPSIDAVLGNDDPVTEILLRVPAKAVLRFNPAMACFCVLNADGIFQRGLSVCTQFFTSELKIYVYLSETKDWKLCASQESFDFLPVNFADGVSWNDAVHWISPMGNGFSFLLDKECLETIPRPPFPENWGSGRKPKS
ncbi:hypothetical protein D5086_000103 [Populus alba]|uniref:Uncharacterized protein n=1 Tax=Populus alba TaxID=43335 RepID=A0ACC4CUW7_POPAL